MKITRRNFVGQALAGLAFVGISLKNSFLKATEPITLEEQNIQKQFGKSLMKLDGSDDYIEVPMMWISIVVLACNSQTHLYVDGELIKTVAEEYSSELAQKLIKEFFLNASSISKSS